MKIVIKGKRYLCNAHSVTHEGDLESTVRFLNGRGVRPSDFWLGVKAARQLKDDVIIFLDNGDLSHTYRLLQEKYVTATLEAIYELRLELADAYRRSPDGQEVKAIFDRLQALYASFNVKAALGVVCEITQKAA